MFRINKNQLKLNRIGRNLTLLTILTIFILCILIINSCSPIDMLQRKTFIKLDSDIDQKVSLLTYNIEAISHKEEDQINNLVEFVNSKKYDFIILQELFSEGTRADIAEMVDTTQYRTIISRVDFNSFPDFIFQDSGLYLMSKYPIVNLSEVDFGDNLKCHNGIIYKLLEKEFSRTYDFLANKSVMGALFQVSSAKKVFLFTTHVQALGTNENKELQISQIYKFIEKGVEQVYASGLLKKDEELSVILAGDFNVDAYNNTWTHNRITHPRLLKLLGNPRDLHKEFNGEKKEYTWNFNSRSYPRRFDYVFTYDSLAGRNLKKLSVQEMNVIDVQDNQNKSISDHKGISAELNFGK